MHLVPDGCAYVQTTLSGVVYSLASVRSGALRAASKSTAWSRATSALEEVSGNAIQEDTEHSNHHQDAC